MVPWEGRRMANIFHMLPKKDWEEAQEKGFYSPKSLENEGFIHFSHTDQIVSVANSLYKGREDLLLLRVYIPLLEGELKEEPPLEAPMSGLIFPHLYGKLNLNAVDKVLEFPCDKIGTFSLPKDLLE